MKTKIVILVLVLCTSYFNLHAQQRVTTTTRATSYDISDNLDLEAVSSIFGESENLEDFEYRLNNPDNRISNLDLNEDGYIDYLRVVENSDDRNSVILIQAVLDQDIYQDVATIEVERVQNGSPRIQIIGDAYIYGHNYIIEPVFYRTPLIFSFFWGPRYVIWHSPYYWNYYPRWYRVYRPYSPFKYRRHIYAHIDYENRYHHTNVRIINYSNDNYYRNKRNDYATRYPDRAFEKRHQGVNNRNELIERRSDRTGNYNQSGNDHRPNTEVAPRRSNTNSPQNNQKKAATEYKRPTYQRSTAPSENKVYKQNQEQRRVQTYERRSESGNKPSVNTERSTKRTETQPRNVEQQQRSETKATRSRTNTEAKQNSKSVQKAETQSKTQKRESRERRREE